MHCKEEGDDEEVWELIGEQRRSKQVTAPPVMERVIELKKPKVSDRKSRASSATPRGSVHKYEVPEVPKEEPPVRRKAKPDLNDSTEGLWVLKKSKRSNKTSETTPSPAPKPPTPRGSVHKYEVPKEKPQVARKVDLKSSTEGLWVPKKSKQPTKTPEPTPAPQRRPASAPAKPKKDPQPAPKPQRVAERGSKPKNPQKLAEAHREEASERRTGKEARPPPVPAKSAIPQPSVKPKVRTIAQTTKKDVVRAVPKSVREDKAPARVPSKEKAQRRLPSESPPRKKLKQPTPSSAFRQRPTQAPEKRLSLPPVGEKRSRPSGSRGEPPRPLKRAKTTSRDRPRWSEDEEEDEDMKDFIASEDEEDESLRLGIYRKAMARIGRNKAPRRLRYDSGDDSSDMETSFFDAEREEARRCVIWAAGSTHD